MQQQQQQQQQQHSRQCSGYLLVTEQCIQSPQKLLQMGIFLESYRFRGLFHMARGCRVDRILAKLDLLMPELCQHVLLHGREKMPTLLFAPTNYVLGSLQKGGEGRPRPVVGSFVQGVASMKLQRVITRNRHPQPPPHQSPSTFKVYSIVDLELFIMRDLLAYLVGRFENWGLRGNSTNTGTCC